MTALLKEESATRLTRHDLALTCLLLNSADYCIDTISALDDKLNDHAYILPGLGDAGDRIFGTK